MNTILTIAGSDPSGGAGIQADLKTFTTLGCYGAAAITAITCQNTKGVSQCRSLSAQLVIDQVTSVLDDIPPSHIKIGMTGSGEIIEALAQCLAGFPGEIIFDPVLKASSGQSLFETESTQALSPLLLKTTVLTPNIPELSVLSGQNIDSKDSAVNAAKILFKNFPDLKALCIKGGHLRQEKKEVVDLLLERKGNNEEYKILEIKHPRCHTINTHGTGCTFASAFAAYYARHKNYQKAFGATVDYMERILNLSKDEKIGQGTGPLQHFKMVTSNSDNQ